VTPGSGPLLVPTSYQDRKEHEMPTRDAIYPAKRHALYDIHRYSAAIRSGDLLFVSGQVGSREDGSPEPVFEDQVRRAFSNLRAVLAAAGCSFDDVVDVTTFHTNPDEQIETVLAVRAEEIGAPPYPNWTAVGVNWLAGFDFEIKVIARIPSTTSSHLADKR
jgi:enamine deaminase RidA (YjgF/YER057c/UK114 family)